MIEEVKAPEEAKANQGLSKFFFKRPTPLVRSVEGSKQNKLLQYDTLAAMKQSQFKTMEWTDAASLRLAMNHRIYQEDRAEIRRRQELTRSLQKNNTSSKR